MFCLLTFSNYMLELHLRCLSSAMSVGFIGTVGSRWTSWPPSQKHDVISKLWLRRSVHLY